MYKRQIRNPFRTAGKAQVIFLAESIAEKDISPVCINTLQTVDGSLCTVSYTHLDVYKRQLLPLLLATLLGVDSEALNMGLMGYNGVLLSLIHIFLRPESVSG